MLKKMLYLLIISFCLSQLNAIHDEAGTTGFAFLKLSYFARASAMGNAFSAASDDANVVFYNPAGLATLTGKKISSTYMSYFDGVNAGAISYAFPYKNGFQAAAFLQYLSATEDRTLVDTEGNYVGKDGTFGASNIAFGLSMAKTLNPSLDFGGTVKFIQETLDSHSASAVAIDLSLLHQTANENLKIGVVLKNAGFQFSHFSDSKYKEGLPTTYIGGFHYLIGDAITATLDLVKPAKHDFYGSLGLEYRLQERFALRTGYKSNSSIWKMGGNADFLSGLSFGFGVNWNQMDFDYALISYGDLGLVNQMSVGYRF